MTWAAPLLAGVVALPPLRVTQEQPAHFRAVAGEAGWPSFGHLPSVDTPGFAGVSATVYGLAAPGEGVKVGFHGVGPEVDPDRRDVRPRPDLAAALEEYVRTWLPGVDASSAVAVSCTYTTTPDSG